MRAEEQLSERDRIDGLGRKGRKSKRRLTFLRCQHDGKRRRGDVQETTMASKLYVAHRRLADGFDRWTLVSGAPTQSGRTSLQLRRWFRRRRARPLQIRNMVRLW